jgi:hypothetical protein
MAARRRSPTEARLAVGQPQKTPRALKLVRRIRIITLPSMIRHYVRGADLQYWKTETGRHRTPIFFSFDRPYIGDMVNMVPLAL